MSTDKISPRRPWLAGLLQLLLPGLGNVYCGRPVRGLVLHLLGQCIGLAALAAIVRLPALLNLLVPLLILIGLTAFIVIDGVRCARAAKPEYHLARYNRWYVYLLIAIAVPVIKIGVGPDVKNIARTGHLATAAMEPTIRVGDYVFVDALAYAFAEPKRGDLAVYNPPRFNSPFIQRIIGLPGETIEIRDKVVFVNGRKLEEPYTRFVRSSNNEPFPGDSMEAITVPPDTYFMLGDNRDNSNDSRFLHPIQRERLIGICRTIYFSRDLDSGMIRWERIGMILE